MLTGTLVHHTVATPSSELVRWHTIRHLRVKEEEKRCLKRQEGRRRKRRDRGEMGGGGHGGENKQIKLEISEIYFCVHLHMVMTAL